MSGTDFALPGRRVTRTSEIPPSEHERLSPESGFSRSIEGASASAALDACIELARAVRIDMDEDTMMLLVVGELRSLLPGCRFLVRLVPRLPHEPVAVRWTTGPVLHTDEFYIERAALARYGLSDADASRAGMEVVDGYTGEYRAAASGFHVPILSDRSLVGTISAEYPAGEEPREGDRAAVGHVALQLGATLTHRHSLRDAAHLEAQVVQTEKLATLGQFVAGVVHEVNNPLTSISVYAEYLRDKLSRRGDEPGDVEKLRRIVHGAERIIRFTRDLVTYARPSSELPRPLRLDELVQQSAVFCEHLIGEVGADIEVEIEPNLPLIIGVRGQIHQILINLITNACHAVPEGAGMISIRAQARGSDRVELTVRDNGAGIPPELQHAVFQPFFSTKGQGKGTGLGLSIVKNLVEQHGGTIRVESTPGAGATFVLSLPADPLSGR